MSAPGENQRQSQDDGSIDNAIAQVERSEYNLGTVSNPFISTEDDAVHLDPVMVYTKGNLNGRAGFLSPDMIAKSIDTWNNNPLYASSDNDPNERVATLEEVLDKTVFENEPPAPGGEYFMGLNSFEKVRRNVTVPLRINISEGTDEKKKPSWVVLRHYPDQNWTVWRSRSREMKILVSLKASTKPALRWIINLISSHGSPWREYRYHS